MFGLERNRHGENVAGMVTAAAATSGVIKKGIFVIKLKSGYRSALALPELT
jgi:hypothetical protein